MIYSAGGTQNRMGPHPIIRHLLRGHRNAARAGREACPAKVPHRPGLSSFLPDGCLLPLQEHLRLPSGQFNTVVGQ